MAESETKSIERILLMEFEIETDALQGTPAWDLLAEQYGDEASVPDKFKILVPVGKGNGGPKQVIDAHAKVGGQIYRAIAGESFNQGFETMPPEPPKLGLKPLG